MKKTREQKIEKLERKLAKLRSQECPINYTYNPSNVFPGNLYENVVFPKLDYEKINAEFQEILDKELEVGKWYKVKDYGSFMICITDIKESQAYGFGLSGEWYNDSNFGLTDLIPCTDQEVKEALIKEAKKRGFKEGVKCNYPFQSFINGTALVENVEDLYFNPNSGVQISDGNGHCILYKGKWAEIIETTPEYTMEELTEKLGKFKLIKK